MKADEDRPSEFEKRVQGMLGESVTHVNARVRSRLNQARHAALAEIEARPRSLWLNRALLPAAGAVAAAAVLAVVLFTNPPGSRLPGSEGGQTAFEDLELLSDNEGLELIENWDGSFYEWAAAQSEEGESGASG